jgi:hypothetical protein
MPQFIAWTTVYLAYRYRWVLKRSAIIKYLFVGQLADIYKREVKTL